MLFSWCDDTVTVLRAGTRVAHGRSVPDWSDPVRIVVGGCALQDGSTETGFDSAQRNPSASSATLLCPEGADIRQGDRVTLGERTWEVDGVPFPVKSPTGRVSHVRVRLREWRG